MEECRIEALDRQALTGGDIGTGGRIDLLVGVEPQEGLGLTDNGAAGGIGGEDLREKEPEGAADGEEAIAAVGAVIGLGEKMGWEEVREEDLEIVLGSEAELLKTPAEGCEAVAPLREIGSCQ